MIFKYETREEWLTEYALLLHEHVFLPVGTPLCPMDGIPLEADEPEEE